MLKQWIYDFWAKTKIKTLEETEDKHDCDWRQDVYGAMQSSIVADLVRLSKLIRERVNESNLNKYKDLILCNDGIWWLEN